jgi:adenine/guanine phosphoribosyltransferase-like PRPP-binding protein
MNLRKLSGPRTSDEWQQLFLQRKALWIHTENKPHIEVVSFNRSEHRHHIGTYFNSQVLIGDDTLAEIARDIVLQRIGGPGYVPIYNATKLVGSENRGVPLFVNELAQVIRELRGIGGEKLTFSLLNKNRKQKRLIPVGLPINKGDRVIIADDAVFTGSTLSSMIDYVRSQRAEVLCIITMFNGASFDGIDSVPIHYLIKEPVRVYSKETCPFCKEQSKVISSPRVNWTKLF